MSMELMGGTLEIMAQLLAESGLADRQGVVDMQLCDTGRGPYQPEVVDKLLFSPGRLRIERWRKDRQTRIFLGNTREGKYWGIWPAVREISAVTAWDQRAKFETKTVTKETVDGTAQTHYSAICKNHVPLFIKVDWWTAADGFPVRIETRVEITCNAQQQPDHLIWNISNRQLVSQNPELFEVPTDLPAYWSSFKFAYAGGAKDAPTKPASMQDLVKAALGRRR